MGTHSQPEADRTALLRRRRDARVPLAAVVALTLTACSTRTTRPAAADLGASTDTAGSTATGRPAGPLGNPAGIRVVDFHAHWDVRDSDLMLARMDEAGIAVAMNYSGGMPRTLTASVQAQKQSGDRLRFFCNIPWSAAGIPDFVGEYVRFLRECRKAGGMGLKISKALGLGVPDPLTGALLEVDDPWLDPIFAEAGRLGMPVSIHTGDPKAFFQPCGAGNERLEELTLAPEWCFADRALYPAWEELFDAFVRRVGRHPGTTIVGVHFGNDPEDPARVAELMRAHPNLWVDTAARIPEIGRRPADELRAVFSEFPDRILFGTDLQVGPDMLVLGAGPPDPSTADIDRFWRSTWRFFETADADIPSPTPIQGRWIVHGIRLAPEALEKLYHANAERLLGL